MKILITLLAIFSFNAYALPVDINRADAKTISQSLKGIGLKKATAIVKYRKENGAFKKLKDLVNVKGIGEKTIKKNKADIRFSKVKEKKKAKKAKKEKKAKKSKATSKK
jgi:competence protein ComEA